MKELQQKIKDWKEWCGDEDNMNDHIRDFFNEQLDKGELFMILDLITSQEEKK